MREIRYRLFHKAESKMYDVEDIKFVHITDVNPIVSASYWNGREMVWLKRREFEIMQWTGFYDKKHTALHEHDLVRVKHKIGDREAHYVDALYEVLISPLYGVYLHCRKSVMSEDQNNQYPIHTELNREHGTLGQDSVNQQYEHLAVMDSWGKNHVFGNSWRQNHYSSDIEAVGNIFQDRHLLKEEHGQNI